jgi:hypothetical protein
MLYTWKDKHVYYFNSVIQKLNQIIHGKCKKSLILLNVSETIPRSNDKIYAVALNISNEDFNWWKKISRPIQMRVDPSLCSAVYLKKTPIFDQPGCQLQTYMNYAAPRCQTQYLKWICENSQLPVDSKKPNFFILPESDHSRAFIPPQPWIIIARDSFVTMCGQLSTFCGLVHTDANCMATGYKSQGFLFRKKCPISMLYDVRKIILIMLI